MCTPSLPGHSSDIQMTLMSAQVIAVTAYIRKVTCSGIVQNTVSRENLIFFRLSQRTPGQNLKRATVASYTSPFRFTMDDFIHISLD